MIPQGALSPSRAKGKRRTERTGQGIRPHFSMAVSHRITPVLRLRPRNGWAEAVPVGPGGDPEVPEFRREVLRVLNSLSLAPRMPGHCFAHTIACEGSGRSVSRWLDVSTRGTRGGSTPSPPASILLPITAMTGRPLGSSSMASRSATRSCDLARPSPGSDPMRQDAAAGAQVPLDTPSRPC